MTLLSYGHDWVRVCDWNWEKKLMHMATWVKMTYDLNCGLNSNTSTNFAGNKFTCASCYRESPDIHTELKRSRKTEPSGRCCVWLKTSSSALWVNYNNDFIEFLQLYMEEEQCSKWNQKCNIYIADTHAYNTFTSDTRSSSSSHAWFSSAAVKCRRGEPLQWEDNLRTGWKLLSKNCILFGEGFDSALWWHTSSVWLMNSICSLILW